MRCSVNKLCSSNISLQDYLVNNLNIDVIADFV